MKNRTRPMILSDKNFDHHVLENPKPGVVHFRANWSGSSDIVAAILDDLAHDFQSKVAFGAVDIDENALLAKKLGVGAVPTLLFFKNGGVVDSIKGVISKDELAGKIETLCAN